MFCYIFLFFYRFGTLHLSVMYTTHTYRVEDFLIGCFFYTLFPKMEYFFAVVYIIIISFTPSFPLYRCTACHGFAMGRTDINTVFSSDFTVALGHEKRLCAFVHGRPISVSSQTEQQLKNSFVCARTDTSGFVPWFVSETTPWHQSPVFIVDKDTAIFYRWKLNISIISREPE